MTLSNPIFSVSGKATFIDARRDMSGLFVCDNLMNPHAGILTAGRGVSAGNIVVGLSNQMAVSVLPFQAVLNRMGALLIMNDAAVTVPLQAAPSTNSRIDTIYLKQNETRAPISDSTDGPVIGVSQGVANITPMPAGIPDGAIELAQVLIPSGVTNTTAGGVVITQTFPYAATRGEELKFRTEGDLKQFNAAEDVEAVALDSNTHYVMEGGVWTQYPNIQTQNVNSGSISLAIGRYNVSVLVHGVTLGSDSWASVQSNITIPVKYRPTIEYTAACIAANGGTTTTMLVVNPNGSIRVQNQGSSGTANARYGTLSYPWR